MKIVMFTNTYLPFVGGVPKSVQSFVEGQKKRGHSCLVISPKFPNAEESEPGVVRVNAIQKFNGSDFSVSIPDPQKISSALDAFEPDIIHTHHPFLLGDAGLRAARRRNLPVVFTHHTLYERYTHYVPFDSDVMKDLVVQLAVKYCNMTDHVIAPSQSVLAYLKELGVKTEISEVPTGVDTAFFRSGKAERARERWDLPEDALFLGHVGRLAREKNLFYLCHSVVTILKECPETRFLLVGDGDDREDLEKLFAEEGLRERVSFAGSLTGQDLADAYAAMDVFLFASTSETQGMVLAEAMAAQTPVIALDAPGAREIIKDGENGRLLDNDSTKSAFAEATISFLETLKQNPDSVRSAVEQTAEAFSGENCNQLLNRVYDKALRSKPSAAPTDDSWNEWDGLISQIRTEWQMLVNKTESIIKSVGKSHHSESKPTLE